MHAASREKLLAVIEAAMRARGPHDPAPRAFEASCITVELEIDYGAYRDLQRHRILTPIVRTLDCALGYHIPDDLRAIGHADRVVAALEEARGTWRRLAEERPLDAQLARAVPRGRAAYGEAGARKLPPGRTGALPGGGRGAPLAAGADPGRHGELPAGEGVTPIVLDKARGGVHASRPLLEPGRSAVW
jgi:hypothetical protein